jgi:hypothetical protein
LGVDVQSIDLGLDGFLGCLGQPKATVGEHSLIERRVPHFGPSQVARQQPLLR